MPATLTYPGVYIEELPSGVRTVTGVATSITAFIGRALRGPVNEPVRVQSFAEFERQFGGLWIDSTLGYAVSHFFLNGGGDALIVRVTSPQPAPARLSLGTGAKELKLVAAAAGAAGNGITAAIANAANHATDPDLFKLTIKVGAAPATNYDDQSVSTIAATLAGQAVQLESPAPTQRPDNAAATPFAGGVDGPTTASLTVGGTFTFTAASPGAWGQKLRLRVEHPTGAPAGTFNLFVRDTVAGTTEQFLNVSTVPTSPRYVKKVLDQQSALIRVVEASWGTTPPTANGAAVPGKDPLVDDATSTSFGTDDGADGVPITDNDISHANLEGSKAGLYALERADLFNLLCIPPLTHAGDVSNQTRNAAATYCRKRRAFYVVDPLRAWTSHTAAVNGVDSMMTRVDNAALFFPMIRCPDPLREGQLTEFAPCGAVAGVMARTDGARGVWKAPAGIDAALAGVSELSVKLTDGENGQLNPIAVNCLRSFPVIGRVIWGARTLRGADQLADQWKYIPVRRLAYFIEESLYRGTQWVVFEPNDEPLWGQIRLNIGAFMQTLFRQGAFQGATPRDAYFVKCSSETTTQTDINNGVVNIIVGFAPLKPAEFVVIKIQQIAQQP
jgi:phage tail sheath protein FI